MKSAARSIVNQFFPPTANPLSRVIMIHGRDQGSAFFVDIDGKSYLVTAAHLIDEAKSTIRIRWSRGWYAFDVEVLTVVPEADLAVLKPSQNLVHPKFHVGLGGAGLALGQHVFFLGFPFGEETYFDIFYQQQRPVPYVKWGAMSAIFDFGNHGRMILDGHNNPGFSGGPVCVNDGSGGQSFCGMVVGLKEEVRSVESWSGEAGAEHFYKQNSGLIYCTQSKTILDAINSKPDGLRLEPDGEY